MQRIVDKCPGSPVVEWYTKSHAIAIYVIVNKYWHLNNWRELAYEMDRSLRMCVFLRHRNTAA